MSREAITSALFSRLVSIPDFRTTGRKVKDWTQFSPQDCPVMLLGVGSSEVIGEAGAVPMWRLEFVAYVYAHDGSKDGPSEQVNDLVDAVEAVLKRDDTDPAGLGTPDATTLEGAVHAARVSRVETDEGSLGDRGVALVTIEVLAAG